MTTGTVAIRGVGQVAITVRDLDRARTFYRDVLELHHLFDAPPKMSFFACGGIRLLLGEPEASDTEPDATELSAATSILYMDVADISAAHEALVSRDVRFDVAPHRVADLGDRELWLAFFRDSEDNVMALMSEIAKDVR